MSRRRSDKGRSYVCTDDVLVKAHSMHLDGMSVRDVAKEAFDQCYSATPNSLAVALINAWRGRGWEVRTQSSATALKNVQRTFRPQCSHVHRVGAAKGQRCERRCVGNDNWCWHHHPDNVAVAVAKLRRAA